MADHASRMLWITPGPVLPCDDGNRQRLFHLIVASTRIHAVTLLTPPLGPGGAAVLEGLGVTVVEVGTGHELAPGRVRAVSRRRPACLVPGSMEILRSYASALPDQFDLAFGPLAAAPAVFAATARRYGLDDQNHEADKYRLICAHEPVFKTRLARLADWAEVNRFERHWLRFPGLVTVCSEEDRRVLTPLSRSATPVVILNGVDTTAVTFTPSARRGDGPPRVVFVGGMAYEPNVDACRILVREIMPRVWAQLPAAELWLVGKDPTAEVRSFAGPRVTVTGRVDNPAQYLHDAVATVVPLRSGWGTRLKVLEAMAAGTPIIATPMAVAGLAMSDGVDALIADTTDALADQVIRLAGDPALGMRLAGAARERAARDYDWSVIGRRFAALL